MLSDSLKRVEEPMMSQILHGVTFHPISIQLLHPGNEVDYEDLSSKRKSTVYHSKTIQTTHHTEHQCNEECHFH